MRPMERVHVACGRAWLWRLGADADDADVDADAADAADNDDGIDAAVVSDEFVAIVSANDVNDGVEAVAV